MQERIGILIDDPLQQNASTCEMGDMISVLCEGDNQSRIIFQTQCTWV